MSTYLIPDAQDERGKWCRETSRFDCFVTVGAPTHALADSFIWSIQNEATSDDPTIGFANTYAIGHGKWGEHRESSGFLLWTDLTYPQVKAIARAAITAGNLRNQEAVGVSVVPAGSALIALTQPFKQEA